MKMSNETKTGLMVLVCLGLLTGLLLKIGNFSPLQKGYTVKSQFRFTAGVKRHAPVCLSGVTVGEVKDIHVLYGDETLVELVLWVRREVKVRLDSQAFITTLGLMGEKYVEIKAGTAEAPYAKEGEMIPGKDPVRLEELIELGAKVADDVGKTARDVSRVAQSVDVTLQENRQKIDRLMDNLEETSENFRDFSQDIKYHPWKILIKGKEKSKEEMAKEKNERLAAKRLL